jgi:hypothetical protein
MENLVYHLGNYEKHRNQYEKNKEYDHDRRAYAPFLYIAHDEIKNRLQCQIEQHGKQKRPKEISEDKNEARNDCTEKQEKQYSQRSVMLQFKIRISSNHMAFSQ